MMTMTNKREGAGNLMSTQVTSTTPPCATCFLPWGGTAAEEAFIKTTMPLPTGFSNCVVETWRRAKAR